MTEIEKLRLLLWEKVPQEGQDTDTHFTDVELAVVLELAGGSMNGAAAIGWSIKGGLYSEMIDINESGSNRRLNQLFTNAERMWKRYSDLAAGEMVLVTAAKSRVAPVSFKILGEDDQDLAISLFTRYTLADYNTRVFPLKRFPAIMQ